MEALEVCAVELRLVYNVKTQTAATFRINHERKVRRCLLVNELATGQNRRMGDNHIELMVASTPKTPQPIKIN
jgi:hypothetical protein